MDSTAISFLGDFNKYLPLKVQQSMMEKGSKQIPYMGFIVDPYCFFLSYPILDTAKAQEQLPEGYDLADVSIFKGGVKHPSVILGVFSVRTSVFTGMRLELYYIARHRETKRLAWIIADYETNTLSHDPKNGFCGYSCDSSYFTTTPYAELLAEVINKKSGNTFNVRVDISPVPMKDLDEDLWVEGNMAVDYGGKLKYPDSVPFSLIFDPVLMKEAQPIDLSKVHLEFNTFLPGIIDGTKPSEAALFPYSQHFVIRQDLKDEQIATTKDLEHQVDTFLERKGFKVMAGDDIKKPLFRSMIISMIFNTTLIIALAIKVLFF